MGRNALSVSNSSNFFSSSPGNLVKSISVSSAEVLSPAEEPEGVSRGFGAAGVEEGGREGRAGFA